MEIDNRKTCRYSMRLNCSTFAQLREIANELRTPLSDIFVVGAFLLSHQAHNPSQFFQVKGHTLAEMAIRSKEAVECPVKWKS
jgi:hypothetical protein